MEGCKKEHFERIEFDEWFKCGEEDWTGDVWYCDKCSLDLESEPIQTKKKEKGLNNKLNYAFLSGVTWMLTGIIIGLLNNTMTNGKSANGLCIFFMFIWLAMGFKIVFHVSQNLKEKSNGM